MTVRCSNRAAFIAHVSFAWLYAVALSGLFLVVEELHLGLVARNSPTWMLLAAEPAAGTRFTVSLLLYVTGIHVVPLVLLLSAHRLFATLRKGAAAAVKRHRRSSALAGEEALAYSQRVCQVHKETMLSCALTWTTPALHDVAALWCFDAEMPHFVVLLACQVVYFAFALGAMTFLESLVQRQTEKEE